MLRANYRSPCPERQTSGPAPTCACAEQTRLVMNLSGHGKLAQVRRPDVTELFNVSRNGRLAIALCTSTSYILTLLSSVGIFAIWKTSYFFCLAFCTAPRPMHNAVQAPGRISGMAFRIVRNRQRRPPPCLQVLNGRTVGERSPWGQPHREPVSALPVTGKPGVPPKRLRSSNVATMVAAILAISNWRTPISAA